MALDKLVDSTQLNTDLTSIANAIRTKGGTSGQLAFPNGFVDAVEAIETSGGGYSADDIAATGITGNVELTVSSIRDNGFRGQPVSSVTGDNITRIGAYSFGVCKSLETVSFPNLTSFGYGAFLESGLKTVSFDSLVSIANGDDGKYAFQECRSLEKVLFPNLETIGTGDKYMFYNAGTSSSYKLVVVLPKIKNLGTRTFDRSYAKAIDIGPDLTAITGADVFYCNLEKASVQTLILRYTGGVVTTANTDRIKGLRDVYVPQALISSYENASNWSTRVAAGKITFHAIEGSVYENAYADGTPIT